MDKIGEVVKTLGRGAFGVASLVNLPSGESRVVKQVEMHGMQPAEREASHKEVGVLRQLKHPHIVEFFDVFLDEATLFIVMEFADGGDLETKVKLRREADEGPFDGNVALKIFGQCLLALGYMHGKRIVHRDMKCQNIFLMLNGDVKIGDFGVSKVMEKTSAAAGTVIGTPSYLAPEICNDTPYGSKVDVWSMGVVLHELIALELPFQAGSLPGLVIKIVSREPNAPPSGTSDEILSILKATFQKDPDERPSADELLELPAVSRNLSAEAAPKPLGMDAFEKVNVLGRGAFGMAFLVHQLSATGRPERVIKTVDLKRMSEDAERRAQDEVEVLRRLSHPHIIAYYDFFTESNLLHIVLEYADGGDLASDIKERSEPYAEKEAVTLFGQCLLALRYIHKRRILHRDIKGQNVFLMKSRDVKLGDFGIAKVMQDTLQEPTELVGTPSYLAPEMCRNAKYDSKVDIWAIGVVLYELVSLRQPFLCSNIAATILKIVSGEPAPLPATCGDDLRQVVGKALQKKPEDRPSAHDLLQIPVVYGCMGSLARDTTGSGNPDDGDDDDVFDDEDWDSGTLVQTRAPSTKTILKDCLCRESESAIKPVENVLADDGSSHRQTTLKTDALTTTGSGGSDTLMPVQVKKGVDAGLPESKSSGPAAQVDSNGKFENPEVVSTPQDSHNYLAEQNQSESATQLGETFKQDADIVTISPVCRAVSSQSIGADDDNQQEEEEGMRINNLAYNAQTGGEEEMIAVIDEIVRLKRELCVHPVTSATMVAEFWSADDISSLRQILKDLSLDIDPDECMSRKALASVLDRLAYKEEERKFLEIRADGVPDMTKAPTRHESVVTMSGTTKMSTHDTISSAPSSHLRDMGQARSGSAIDIARCSSTSAPVPSSPCRASGKSSSAQGDSGEEVEDRLMNLLREANEGGGDDEMMAFVHLIAEVNEQEGLHPNAIAKATVGAWSDIARARQTLNGLVIDKRLQEQEHVVRRALVSALNERAMEDEMREFAKSSPSECFATKLNTSAPSNSYAAAGNALSAVRLKRRQLKESEEQ